MTVPPMLCVVGKSGSGKTTLLSQVVRELTGSGMKVGAVKHAAGGLDVEPEGKDSSRLAAAGARPVICAGPDGAVVRGAPASASLADLAATFCADCDVVLAEGYKSSSYDKVLVVSADDPSGAEAERDLTSVRLVVTAGAEPPAGATARDAGGAVSAWVRQWADRRRRLGAGVIGAILVGGPSRRMGTDKAAMRVGGRAVLVHLAELLLGRVEEVWVVGRPVAGVGLPACVRWHLDVRGGCGPLGGIDTALRLAQVAGPRAVLVVACDMPAFGPEAVELLLAGRRADRPAAALRNPATGRLEPLAAVYEPDALPEIERALDAGILSVTALLESIGAEAIDVPAELADQLANANTPGQLAAIERQIRGG